MGKKICIVINSLVQGGAQKSAILLAENLHNRGHQVEILTFYPQDSDFFTVPSGIKINRLIFPFQDRGPVSSRFVAIRVIQVRAKRLLNRIRDVRELRKIFKSFDPDLIISFEAATSILAFFVSQKKCPLIISERIHPKYHAVPRWAAFLRPYVYMSSRVTLHCQGKLIAAWMEKKYRKNVISIPNFLGERNLNIWDPTSTKIKIFSRFAHQKGIDIAIDAWSRLPKEVLANFTLEIFGDGDKEKYQRLISNYQVESSVKLFNPTNKVREELGDCLIYILPSRFEGFPNALTEAMSCGIPSLVTDCPSAIREITLNGKLALLSEVTPSEISRHLQELLGSKERLMSLSQSGPHVQNYFDDSNTLIEWEELIGWVLDGRQLPQITCKCCLELLNSDSVVGIRTRHGLMRELNSDWNIKTSKSMMGAESLIAAYECKKCDCLSFNSYQGNLEFYDSCYESPNYSRTTPWDYSMVLKDFASQNVEIQVLDFGGGKSLLAQLDPELVKLTVIDLSNTVQVALQNNGVRCVSSLSELSSKDKYDFIMFSHSIEHLDNPIEVLTELVEHLQPGARIAVTTPDSQNTNLLTSPLAWPPHHTNAFNPKALTQLMKKIGLKQIEVKRNVIVSESNFDFMCVGVK